MKVQKKSSMNTRNKSYLIRLTEEEYQNYKERSSHFQSIAHYIRSAVSEYSNVDAKRKLQLFNDLYIYYKEYEKNFFHIAGNLNQAMKRCNELNQIGLLSDKYIFEIIKPEIDNIQNQISEMRNELDKIYNKYINLK